MSLISRQAIALALLAMTGTAASAQSSLSLMAPTHHRVSPQALPVTDTPALTFGRSLVTAPVSGSGAAAGPLVPPIPGAAPAESPLISPLLVAANPWTALGPGPLFNGGGAFGGFNGSYDGGIGQNTSGRIIGLAVDPVDIGTYYIASAGGGIWKTTDAGKTYTPLTDFLGDTAMGSITIAPSNHNVIYAGTGEANFAIDSRWGIGLLKSIDGGSTWSIIPGPTTSSSPNGVFYRKGISRIVVDPNNSNVVYLGTVLAGQNGNGFVDGGVWKTTDGGTTWTNTTVNKVDNNALYTDLVMNSKNPNILYTAVGYYAGFADNGVYKTTDGGTTWTMLAGGLPVYANGDPVGGQTTLALYSSADGNSDTLYASIPNNQTEGLLGLYKSSNSGATFTKLNAPNYLGGQAFYDNAVVVSPNDPNVFFAAGQVNYGAVYGFTGSPTNYNDLRTIVGTTDGGQTFHDFSLGQGFVGPHTDTHALTFTADGKLLDGNDGGIWRLENPLIANPTPPANDMDASGSNLNWTDINGGLNTLQFTGIALDPSNAGVAYGGAQDNGTSKLSGGAWNQISGGDGGFTRVDAANTQTIYHEFTGISLQRSDDGGLTFRYKRNGINLNDPSPDDNLSVDPTGDKEPAAFYVPFKLDPLNTTHVVISTDHVYLSTDRGENFTAVGTPGQNGYNPPVKNSSGNPTNIYVNTLGIAGQAIYVEIGSHVYATFDGGSTWADRSIPTVLNGGSHLSDFYVNPGNPLDVYATRPRFDGAAVGKIFRSTNGGVTWNNISSNLPDIPFNSVRLDQKSGVLYVAGDDGVYSSTNYGGSWTRIPGSLPTVQVTDLDVSNPTGLLGAGTHGRGLWTTPLSTVVAKPNLKLVPTVTRVSANTIQVRLTLANFGSPAFPAGIGNADALNASLSVSLNGQSAAPVQLGAVPAYGNSQSATVTFTNVPAGYASLRYSGTYTGSSFSGFARVSVP